MPDPQKVSAHLIYFCDLPDLANLRFLFSAKWSRHKIFFSHFLPKLDKSSLDCREKNHNNKKKRSKFFLYFGWGRCGESWNFRLCFLLESFFGSVFLEVKSYYIVRIKCMNKYKSVLFGILSKNHLIILIFNNLF